MLRVRNQHAFDAKFARGVVPRGNGRCDNACVCVFVGIDRQVCGNRFPRIRRCVLDAASAADCGASTDAGACCAREVCGASWCPMCLLIQERSPMALPFPWGRAVTQWGKTSRMPMLARFVGIVALGWGFFGDW